MTALREETDAVGEPDPVDLYFELAGYRPSDIIGVCWMKTVDGIELDWAHVKVADAAAEIAKHRGLNTWVNAAIFKQKPKKRGKREDMGRLPALYADLDFKCFSSKPEAEAIEDQQAIDAVNAVIEDLSVLLGEMPTVVIDSGGGAQPRWRTDRDVDNITLARFGKLVKQVAEEHGGTADSVFERARLLRAPGSTNNGFKRGVKVYREARPTEVVPVEGGDTVDMDRVIEQLDGCNIQYKSERERPPAPTTPLAPGRGNKYAQSAMQRVMDDLKASASWAEGHEDMTTGKGRGWEKFQADAAYRLASLALAGWNDLTLAQAQQAFLAAAPTDSGWTFDMVTQKWDYQSGYAVAADRPDDIEIVATNLVGIVGAEDIERLTGQAGGADASPGPEPEAQSTEDPSAPAEPEQLPWPDGFTEADLMGIYIVRVGEGADATPKYQYPRGVQFEVSNGLEQKVEQHHQIVITEHTGDHMEIRVPWCTLCEARAKGVDPTDQVATVVADARLRWQLQLRSKLPKATIPADDEKFIGLDDLFLRPPALYLIDGVLPQHGVGVLTARDAMGKTFFAIDVAMNIAAGLDTWHGRDVDIVNDGGVLYLMGEGASAAPKRLGAWLEGNPRASRSEITQRLLVRPGSVNLFTGGPAFEGLYKLARNGRPDLIVIDTMQTNSTGADHNNSTDMGIIHSRLRALQRACGGVVLVLAHTGKSDRDARGSSSIEDDADFVMHVDEWNVGGAMKVSITKMKDGPEGEITLKVEKVGDSLVLRDRDHLGKVIWSSADLDSRIKGILFSLKGEGPQTPPSIMAGLAAQEVENPKLKKAVRGSVHRRLSRMADGGELVRVRRGSTIYYGLPDDAEEPDPEADEQQSQEDWAEVRDLFD